MPKKNRRKQRREANNGGGANHDDGPAFENGTKTPAFKRYLSKLLKIPPADIVDQIRLGRDIPTQAVAELTGRHLAGKRDPLHVDYRGQLVDAGLIPQILRFLGNCENENFQNVLLTNDDGKGKPRFTIRVGGYSCQHYRLWVSPKRKQRG